MMTQLTEALGGGVGRFSVVGSKNARTVEEAELASYFGVAPEIVGFVSELLQDLWELGSDPELIVQWLQGAGLAGAQTRVLDLGCGKGAVAIAVAEALGCRVDGVDALSGFVEVARGQARRLGLEHLCRFELGDLRETVQHAHGYDAVLLIAVGVLGSTAEMVGGCRRCVPPGGVIIIDGAYLREPGKLDFPGYRELTTRDETLRQLTSFGDHLVRERTIPVEAVHAQNQRYTGWIERRAEELSARHPEHADAFHAYVNKEQQECAILETAVTCATWMLQRA
jgi:cyclopropane fatty-acyl-phospholipid synthase-like methyltransferase